MPDADPRLIPTRDAAAALLARDQLGRDVFPRGEPESLASGPVRVVQADGIGDLVAAYLRVLRRRGDA